ncbi:MAG: chaperone NapD [Phyllobacteriaceae bacterium]|nr:chaperone NapD [Phyllobacteriaceae bacterium]
MNVIGVLVWAVPGTVEAVSAALAALPGVDVHAATDDGRLVVTATDVDGLHASDALMAMNQIAGVITTSLVYHACEPDEETAVAA